MNTETFDSQNWRCDRYPAGTPRTSRPSGWSAWTAKRSFAHIPGQCAMLSIPGVGEAHVLHHLLPHPSRNIWSSRIKKCGCLTSWLHAMDVGQQITIRGPYGNGFPVDTDFKGKDLLFIAGGVGLAPLHSVINYCPGQTRELRPHPTSSTARAPRTTSWTTRRS